MKSNTAQFRSDKGFTLIEVMVGIALTALLILSLSAMWAMIVENFFNLTLRQKAILALNGEMERLVAIYQFDPTIVTTDTVTIDNDGDRLIFSEDQVAGFMKSAASTFNVGEVNYLGNGQTARNLIWLDKNKNIVGALSWKIEDLSEAAPILPAAGRTFSPVTNAANCQTSSCQFLVLYIRYPYRFTDTPAITPAASSIATGDENNLEEIELQAIVGRRAGA